MIQIHKSSEVPIILTIRGEKKKDDLCKEFENGKTSFKSDEFDSKIYSDPTVKKSLHQTQYGKCCYCETKISLKGADVEHYRPKTHYYWLAYDWSNLFLSCMECNQRCKRDQFPLKDHLSQAKSHKDTLDQEQPLLINPAETDPAQHITFTVDGEAKAVEESLLGQTTIKILDLNRDSLRNRREELLHEKLSFLYKIANYITPDSTIALPISSEESQAVLNKCTQDQSEDAAFARIMLAQLANEDAQEQQMALAQLENQE